MAYSYACADCEGMETCPGQVIAATEDEVWKLMELHARIAHDEDAGDWDEEPERGWKLPWWQESRCRG